MASVWQPGRTIGGLGLKTVPALGARILSVVIAATFMWAGLAKLLDLHSFRGSVASFDVIPSWSVGLIGMTLPPLELILGIMVLTGLRKRAAALGLTVLCLGFLVLLGQAFWRGLPVDCGCFGSSGNTAEAALLPFLRALGVFLLCVTATVCEYRRTAN